MGAEKAETMDPLSADSSAAIATRPTTETIAVFVMLITLSFGKSWVGGWVGGCRLEGLRLWIHSVVVLSLPLSCPVVRKVLLCCWFSPASSSSHLVRRCCIRPLKTTNNRREITFLLRRLSPKRKFNLENDPFRSSLDRNPSQTASVRPSPDRDCRITKGEKLNPAAERFGNKEQTPLVSQCAGYPLLTSLWSHLTLNQYLSGRADDTS